MNNFDHIPDDLLVEILSRLVCNIELVFQCKCVAKRWLLVISTPNFIGRCVHVQRDLLQKPIPNTIVIFNNFVSSDDPILSFPHPFLKSRSRNFILGFLPCYRDLEKSQKLAKSLPWRIPLQQGQLVPPVVMGTYKDLVLCCATKSHQRDYFICNPITKQWVALPPTPRPFNSNVQAVVAFVCDPYYYDGVELQVQQHNSNAAMLRSTIINARYMWKVVRLVPRSENDALTNFNVEIFSSQTREWRELVVLRSRPLCSMFDGLSSAVAYKGMLYWYGVDGLIFELDLADHNYNKKNNNIAKCRFIKLPKGVDIEGFGSPHLVVTRGRLRLYQFIGAYYNEEPSVRAWDLKEVVKDDGGWDDEEFIFKWLHKFKFKWLVDKVPLSVQDETMSFYRPAENDYKFEVLRFHKHNEDVMYFQYRPYLATCNVSGSGRFEIITKIEFDQYWYCCDNYNYPFLFPWWPTPVHI